MREPTQSRALRVLMTADTVGGVWSYCVELGRALHDAGVELLIATMGPRPSAEQRQELTGCGATVLVESDYALEWMDDPWVDVDAALSWLLELERLFEPDVIHLNGYAHAAAWWQAPTVVVAHSCVTSWWQAVYGEEPPARYDEYRARVVAGLAQATAVVAPTRAMLSALVRNYGPQPRARVIHNGLSSGAQAELRRKQPFFLAAGRLWDPAKNLGLLLDAAAHYPWPLKIAGELPTPQPSPPPNVELLGRTPRARLRELMADAAVFVHPARYEPFGLAPLEAALAGCALVLSDIDSLREIWGDAALYASSTDAAQLAATAAELARDGARRGRLAAAARRQAGCYGAEAMARAYVELYRELVERRSLAQPVASTTTNEHAHSDFLPFPSV